MSIALGLHEEKFKFLIDSIYSITIYKMKVNL